MRPAQPVFDGAAFVTRSQFKKQSSQAEVQYQVAEQDLILRVAKAYFEVLLAQDRTVDFIDILGHELEQLETSRLDATERAALEHSWRDKIRRARAGEQRWGVCMARKPE